MTNETDSVERMSAMSLSNATYQDAMRKQRERREASREKRRNRKVRQRPWVVLMEEWHEEMKGAFGKDYTSSPWGEAEKALARKFIKEDGFDEALELVRRFLRTWNRTGTPGFKLFWTMRDSVRAELRGQADTRQKRVNRDEYNAERAATCPDVGW